MDRCTGRRDITEILLKTVFPSVYKRHVLQTRKNQGLFEKRLYRRSCHLIMVDVRFGQGRFGQDVFGIIGLVWDSFSPLPHNATF